MLLAPLLPHSTLKIDDPVYPSNLISNSGTQLEECAVAHLTHSRKQMRLHAHFNCKFKYCPRKSLLRAFDYSVGDRTDLRRKVIDELRLVLMR